MISVPSVLVLVLVNYLTLCESLKCYESGGQGETDRIVKCAGMCMSYRHEDANGTIVRRCCTDDCEIRNNHKAYFCMKDKCNGIHSDRKLPATHRKRMSLKAASSDNENGSSLSCYDCSAHNPDCGISTATLVQGCQTCMVYRNTYDNNNVLRRCCTFGCGSPGTIGELDGRQTYFCSSNGCNGIGAEKVLSDEADSVPTMPTIVSTTTASKTSFSCYECSGLNEQPCITTALNCPMCMVYRNDNDPAKFDRRCCWWGCGSPNQITDYAGRPTYFCNADNCNGVGSEVALSYVTTTSSGMTNVTSTITTTTSMPSLSTKPSSSQCYDCSGSDCGTEGSPMSMNCPTCMVYRNPDDQTKIERHCCWWNCGLSDSVSTYNGIQTYFCAGDKCNGYGAEYALGPPVTTMMTMIMMTTTIATATTTSVTTEPPASQCYDCSGPDCGREGSPMSMHCPKCMVYRNPTDQTKIERRCCWWSCGSSNSLGTYNGVETYFCTGNKCNGYGAEYALSPPVTTTTTATTTTSMLLTTTVLTTTTRAKTIMTTTTAVTTEQPSSQCYDCSGPDCGRDGSSMSMNCPKCMVYRNPTDQTTIERRCCWWGCGPSNSLGTHNGVETYFCTGNKCNGYGAEYALSPAVTTTTVTMMTTSTASSSSNNTFPTTTTTASSAASCVLNCQNSGTPETEDGCFCYCLENTNGRECENVDCAQPDVSAEICSLENRSLCEESETFAFECLHLCGKC